MALSIEQKPVNSGTYKIPAITNWNPVIGYMILQNDIDGLFYFKLILEVYTGTSAVADNLIAKIKQRKNGYSSDVTASPQRARAFFDLRDIANTQLVNTVFDQNDSGVPFQAIHGIGDNTPALPFSTNGDRVNGTTQIISLFVRGYQESSDAQNTSPTEDTGSTVTDSMFWLSASLPLFTDRSTDADYIQAEFFNVFCLNGATKRFLSDQEKTSGEYGLTDVYRTYVGELDFHTVAFLNGETDFNSLAENICIQYYDKYGNTIDSPGGNSSECIRNFAANGGAAPMTVSGEVDGDNDRLIYFGCGVANLESQDDNTNARPSGFANWAYYKIWAGLDAGGVVSDRYYFIKQSDSCKGFAVRRLAWRNSVGGYDYWNFNMKSTQTVNVERNNFSTILGT